MRRGLAALVLPASTFVVLSCTSDGDPEAAIPDDAGEDVAVPPDTGGAIDAAKPEPPAPPAPLEVRCEGATCYLSVRGNGGHHLCGLMKDGTVRCWGRDTESATSNDGALGRGSAVSAADGATPAPVVGLSEVTQLSVGTRFGTCARRKDGKVWCWGRNDAGQLGGPPSQSTIAVATEVSGLPPASEVALGARIACAIGSTDHTLYCWGAPVPGLGIDLETVTTFTPRAITTFPSPVKAVVIATWNQLDTVVALLDDGVLASAGPYVPGARSVTWHLERPQEVTGVARIGPFAYVTDEGRLKRWRPPLRRRNDDGTYNDPYLPEGAPIVEAKSSGEGTHEQGGALLSTGRLFRWGNNVAGCLGLDPKLLPVASHPLAMTQITEPIVSFATTSGSTCVSLVNGAIECWGANAYGELGRGTVDGQAHPEAEVIR